MLNIILEENLYIEFPSILKIFLAMKPETVLLSTSLNMLKVIAYYSIKNESLARYDSRIKFASTKN